MNAFKVYLKLLMFLGLGGNNKILQINYKLRIITSRTIVINAIA